MKVILKKFNETYISDKVRWINDEKNNKFLHYDLPLEIEKTQKWYEAIKDRNDRYDAIIEVDGIAVGLIGLLSIDRKNRKAEYYITMGEQEYKGKGIAYQASKLLLKYAFEKLHLQLVYLYTEVENAPAQCLFEKVGFQKEGVAKCDLFRKGKIIDRFYYSLTIFEYTKKKGMTPIQFIGECYNNQLFVKREDLLMYSFGGNKARKAELFFEEIDRENYICVVTYGSTHSNHCRVIANMAAKRKIPCIIISPQSVPDETYNSRLMKLLDAQIVMTPVEQVSTIIDKEMCKLREKGYRPYFIEGGGHGNIGTQSYVNCYEEIITHELDNKVKFDYIFFATGTGTTQAGLVCGQLINYDNDRKIIGISIARKEVRGKKIVINSIKDYLNELSEKYVEQDIVNKTIFIDDYIGNGYGSENTEIDEIIKEVFIEFGIPMDSTYTAKAFNGMKKYIIKEQIKNKKILFIHTGGTPLFFDDIGRV